MQLIQTLYRYLDPERIRNEVHKNIYGANSQGNELTKKVILVCHKIKKNKFEKLYILESLA
jgi:hypothetical protein